MSQPNELKKLDFDLFFQKFNDTVIEIQCSLYLDFFIVDGKKSGDLYKIMFEWYEYLHENLDNIRYKSSIPILGEKEDENTLRYKTLLKNLQDALFKCRERLTSFPNMLKELICNKTGLTFSVMASIIILSAVLYYFNYAKPISNPVYILQVLTN